jgi:uncharacterized membrane protein YeaQ/YmgE (transglycosylase-associated protein family)
MLLWNCLWIGALAGAVASRLMRGPGGRAPLGGCVAVGVLGALLGGLAGSRVDAFPHAELAVAGGGAAVVLAAWGVVRGLAAAQDQVGRNAGSHRDARSAARRG